MTDRHRPSSFLATKGLFPEHTYRAFQRWDVSSSLEENVRIIRTANTVGGPSIGWLKDFGKIILRRFGPAGPATALVELARHNCDLQVWKPLLLWHGCETDHLLRSFLSDWLFGQQQRGVVRVSREAVEEFLRCHLAANNQAMWSDSNIEQSSSGMLRTAGAFGLLTEGRGRMLTGYHLPEASFLYVAYVLMQRYASSSRVVADPSWRLFMLSQGAVEEEFLRLHQLHRLQFNRAGSLVELVLPCKSADDFVRSILP